MPRYLYSCKSCDTSIEAVHSYREKLSECKECGDKFGLYKNLSTPITTRSTVPHKKAKVGSATREAIKDAHEQVEIAKKQLKKRKNK